METMGYKQYSQAQLLKTYGKSADKVRAQLVSAKINLGVAGNTISLPVHKSIKTSLEAACKNYRNKVKRGEAPAYKLLPKYCGSFNWRNIKRPDGSTGSTLSMHSFGIAIDLNSWNPNGQGKNAKSDIPNPELVKSFERYGFFWGGKWSGGSRDPMHFEYAPLSFAEVVEVFKVTRKGGTGIYAKASAKAAKPGVYAYNKTIEAKRQSGSWVKTGKGYVQTKFLKAS
jgi:hypothetical protein